MKKKKTIDSLEETRMCDLNPLKLSFPFKSSLHKNNLKYLREIAKHNKVKISGKKGELVERLHLYFKKEYSAILLQKYYRGHLVRRMTSATSTYKRRKQCVNETDFYSMEPLDEIPFILFYTIQQGAIVYGFNIESLVHYIRRTPEKMRVKNPYTRDEFSDNVLESVQFQYRRIQAHFPKAVDSALAYTNDATGPLQACIALLDTIRRGTIEQRVRGIFMEMDSLGNYTDSAWFLDLYSKHEYRRLYRVLYNIWFHHARLSSEIRAAICIIGDPFENILGFMQTVEADILCEKCVRVLEHMVYCGKDTDHRKLGAFHVLTAFTVVSMNARLAMPWLYESLF